MLKTIANVFNGDDENSIYEYKTGSDLVRFFNQYFNRKDTYKNPFPSRWRYVVDILLLLLCTGFLSQMIITKSFIPKKSKHKKLVEDKL